MMIYFKIKCYDENNQEPNKYYTCIEKYDKIMKHNSQIL